MKTIETGKCAVCDRVLPVADDETDTPPAPNEVVLDSAGETDYRNYYVCGHCWPED